MRIEEQSYKILYPATQEDWDRELSFIAQAGRTAYQSEAKDSDYEFASRIVRMEHLAVIEFGNMIVRFITDRGVSHELVRHRLCSFVQESTRYCNYKKNGLTFIRPSQWGYWSEYSRMDWAESCQAAENAYLKMTAPSQNRSAQEARAVLPSSTKTDIVVKANFREWRHIFSLRCSVKAHPDMRLLMRQLYNDVRLLCPAVFEMGSIE